MSTRSSTALFLFLITISTFPSMLKSTVQVKYSRDPVRRTEGQPLTLKCTAEYEEENCGNIRVSWCLTSQELTDPDRYLIHINETKIGGNRHRDAFITFTQLTVNSTGFYQCKAVCQHTGTTAIGHVISVNVTGDANKGLKTLNRSDRHSVDVFLLAISVFILL
ncbi:hypothetical protein PHYPO_G00150830 [Pangasianodon hypophthalmus]|uniref:Ig-like domain-containing protein n=1 Tax=Pangasianodon hypophthalmus TaxID=310915 RepID=A0A5N5JXI3_PANHP|nr:hypothetical protein PHYPO_G00150830 [Pangasianodon hypophthalmus]